MSSEVICVLDEELSEQLEIIRLVGLDALPDDVKEKIKPRLDFYNILKDAERKGKIRVKTTVSKGSVDEDHILTELQKGLGKDIWPPIAVFIDTRWLRDDTSAIHVRLRPGDKLCLERSDGSLGGRWEMPK